MVIKLVVLDKADKFSENFIIYVNRFYSHKLKITFFDKENEALNYIKNSETDVFIVNPKYFSINHDKVIDCRLMHITENTENKENENIIFKYQKGSLICEKIIEFFQKNDTHKNLNHSVSTKCESESIFTGDKKQKTQIILFTSPCGGVGTSTVAASSGVALARKGFEALYINFEIFGQADYFFRGVGRYDLKDVFYAYKLNEQKFLSSLKSYAKKDETGVYFYSSTKISLDLIEMAMNDKLELISKIVESNEFDYIILDIDFGINQQMIDLFKIADRVVLVSSDTDISKQKIQRASESLFIEVEVNDSFDKEKIVLIMNKCKTLDTQKHNDINCIGSILLSEKESTKDILSDISKSLVFEEFVRLKRKVVG